MFKSYLKHFKCILISLNLKSLGLITPLSFPIKCIKRSIIGPISQCKYLRTAIYSSVSGIAGFIVIPGNLDLMRTNLTIEGYGGKIPEL